MTGPPGRAHWLRAGIVGRPHGLDGSFYVVRASPELLAVGVSVRLGEAERVIERRAGTDRRPILRLSGCHDREDVEPLRGGELLVARAQAPQLEDDEWWVQDLEGCAVQDGDRAVGTVLRVLALPSCEVLVVQRGAGELLVPLVSDAVREVDVQARHIDIDLRFLGEE